MGFFTRFVIVFIVALCSNHQFVVSTDINNRVPVIFAFGDSNTDTGNYRAASGKVNGYPLGRFFPYHPSDRASDGKLIIDYLCENITTNYLHAYMNAFEPDFGNGVNFAYDGSSATYPGNGLKTQFSQFTRFQNRSLELLSKGSKQKLVGEDGFKRALYLIDIGQNDMTKSSLARSSYDDMIGRIPNVTFQIKDAMKGMYLSGGRKFWVHNTGPLGCLPGIFAFNNNNMSDVDQYVCIKFLNEAARELNRNIFELCEELRREMNDATIVYVDIYAIKYDLIANASSYGFVDPLTSCLQATSTCDGPKTVNWDGWHYTHAANAFVASRILSTNYSSPSIPFSFFMNG